LPLADWRERLFASVEHSLDTMLHMKRSRLLFASLFLGSFISCVLSIAMWTLRIGPWFPPFWPGWFLAIASTVVNGGHWNTWTGIAIATIGNALFYAWISFLVIRSDAVFRGRIGRSFLQ
jgi:hypothetical protein